MAPSSDGRAVATSTDDWTVRAADTIEGVVGVVRDRAVVPVTRVARWLVFGVLAAMIGTTILILLAIGLVRVAVAYIPPHRAWGAHLYTGGIFSLLGLFLWSRRTPRDRS